MAAIINNAGAYLLTYAGVPFWTDDPKIVRMGMARDTPVSEPRDPLKKQQAEEHILDEIDRLIPFRYTDDFGLPPPPQRNLSNIAWQSQFGPMPSPDIRIGDWYYPHDACRWSVFRGLMTSSQVKTVLARTLGGNSAPFVMQALPDGQIGTIGYTITSRMFMLPPRCLGEHGTLGAGGSGLDGLYLVTLVDERYLWQWIQTTLHPRGTTIWDDLIFQLSLALDVEIVYTRPIDPVYTSPEPDSQFWTNEENAAVLLDAVAANIGCDVVRHYDGSYLLLQRTESMNRVNGNLIALGYPSQARLAGGNMFQPAGTNLPIGPYLQLSKNITIPGAVKVTFPKYVYDPVPHFFNSRYQNQRPSCWYEDSYGDVHTEVIGFLSGGIINIDNPPNAPGGPPVFSGLPIDFITVSGSQIDNIQISGQQINTNLVSGFPIFTFGPAHTIHTTAKALMSGEDSATLLNQGGITYLSMKLANDYYGQQLAAALDEVYPGTVELLLEGIHDVIWTYSPRSRIASTRVLRTQWNNMVREMQHSTPTLASITSGGEFRFLQTTNIPAGVGGPSVAQTIRDRQGIDNQGLELYGSGYIETNLTTTLLSGDQQARLQNVDYFPTQNRWRCGIEDEILLMEGCSGFPQTLVDIVYRAIDGTKQPDFHPPGAIVTQYLPNITYGVNLSTYEKMQFVYPHEWTSGGIQGTRIVPQMQTVRVLSASGVIINRKWHYSGQVRSYEPTHPSSQFINNEYVWLRDRDDRTVASGRNYNGQLVGYSKGDGLTNEISSGGVFVAFDTAPIYLINGNVGGMRVSDNGPSFSVDSNPCNWLQFENTDFELELLEDYLDPGDHVRVKTEGFTGSVTVVTDPVTCATLTLSFIRGLLKSVV